MALFNTDFDGITRPQGSFWDIGAYEFTGGPPPPPPPPPTATITIIAPNGGERLKTNRWKSFYWFSTDLAEGAMMKVELSRNNGSSYQFLFNTPNAGSANWWVTGPTSSTCRIRLSSVDDPNIFAISLNVFKIL